METTIQRTRFPVTNWKRIRDYQNGRGTIAHRALSEICELYWYPLYAFARRSGNSPSDAEDMTQGFFEQLLEKGFLDEVAEDKGKLRNFLLVALKHYMAKQWRDRNAPIRYPSQGFFSIDQLAAEERYHWEPAEEVSPDLVYERHWATTLLKRVGDRLRDEFAANGKRELFESLRGFLSLQKPDQPYAQVAQRFNMTENAVAVTACRMRDRFRELLRNEVAETVGSWEDVDEELDHLLRVLS